MNHSEHQLEHRKSQERVDMAFLKEMTPADRKFFTLALEASTKMTSSDTEAYS